MSAVEDFRARRDAMRKWLGEKHPEISVEQLHTTKGTSERAYWHSGYCVALSDVLRRLERESEEEPISDNRGPGTDNLSRPVCPDGSDCLGV